jgi:Ca2+-binding RTX toxin-like protein
VIQALGEGQTLTDRITVTSADGTASQVITVTINGSNDLPTSTNDSILIDEDLDNTSNLYTLKVDDFGSFSDEDAGNTLRAIHIDTLPTNGILYLNGVAVSVGADIDIDLIEQGKLTFDPTDNTDTDSSFDFHVSDGSDWSADSYSTSITITAVADTPILQVATSSSTTGNTLAPDATQHGNGLTLSYYDNVSNLDSNSAKSTSRVETVLEATTPTTQTVATNLGTQLNVPEDDAYSAKGLIYLEAGHTYTFTGYHDDTLRIEIGGTAIVNVGFNSWGDYAASYTPQASGYYSFEMFAYNGDNVGAISVKVAVDSGVAQDLSTSNIPLYTDIGQVDAIGLQHGSLTSVGDGGYYASTYNHGMVGTTIHLASITATTPDTDGSEMLALVLKSLPEGSVLSDGTHSFVATATSTEVDISQWNTSQLTFDPPFGFTGKIDLVVEATTTESSNSSHASTESTVTITVDADSIQTLDATYTSVATTALGLSGEYYGYNETSSPGDGYVKQSADGSVGNLDNNADVNSVILSRTGLTVGATNPVAADDSKMDASFDATTFNYGNVSSGSLGYISSTQNDFSRVTSGNLRTFLNNNGSGKDGTSLKSTVSYGHTTDAIIRILGSVYFEEGSYQFKVTADDGYTVYIDGVAVVSYDKNVATATTTGSSVALSEGLHQVEIVYWDQGGEANFSMSYKESSDSNWSGFNSTNLLMLQEGYTLSDLQDVVQASDDSWMIRTGESATGTVGQDLITGSEGKDIIHGDAGNDVLSGEGAVDKLYGDLGNDILVGGSGNDILTGGDGKDTFTWQHGDQGTTLTPAVDHITDFDELNDVIDISDLLDHDGSKSSDVLENYLSISKTSDGSVSIDIHDPDASSSSASSSSVLQSIVLDGVSYSDLTGSSSSSASDVLDHLLSNHLLNIDK